MPSPSDMKEAVYKRCADIIETEEGLSSGGGDSHVGLVDGEEEDLPAISLQFSIGPYRGSGDTVKVETEIRNNDDEVVDARLRENLTMRCDAIVEARSQRTVDTINDAVRRVFSQYGQTVPEPKLFTDVGMTEPERLWTVDAEDTNPESAPDGRAVGTRLVFDFGHSWLHSDYADPFTPIRSVDVTIEDIDGTPEYMNFTVQ